MICSSPSPLVGLESEHFGLAQDQSGSIHVPKLALLWYALQGHTPTSGSADQMLRFWVAAERCYRAQNCHTSVTGWVGDCSASVVDLQVLAISPALGDPTLWRSFLIGRAGMGLECFCLQLPSPETNNKIKTSDPSEVKDLTANPTLSSV